MNNSLYLTVVGVLTMGNRWHYLILFLLVSLTGRGQEEIVLFSGTKQDVTVEMVVHVYEDGRKEHITRIQKGTRIILQDEHTKPLFFPRYWDVLWKPYHFFTVFDFIVKDKLLFVFYNDHGQIYTDKFILNENSIDIEGRFLLGEYFTMSYANGGDSRAVLTEQWIGDELYFYIVGQQHLTGRLSQWFHLREGQLYRLIFPEIEKLTLIKPLPRHPTGVLFIDYEKLYCVMPPEEEAYMEKKADILTIRRQDSYIPSITLDEEKKLSPEQQNKILEEIQYLLSRYDNRKIHDIRLEGYTVGEAFKVRKGSTPTFSHNFYSDEMIYFFVRINEEQLLIVRYCVQENLWVISDYIEEVVNDESEGRIN